MTVPGRRGSPPASALPHLGNQDRLHEEILGNLTEGVVVVRSSDQVIVYTNQRFDGLFGYSSGELHGQPVSVIDSPHPDTPAATRRARAELRERGVWCGEVENRRKDGSTLWTWANVSQFDDPVHGKLWCAIHRDITARKDAEAALHHKTQSRLEILERLSPVGIFQSDASGRCIWVNQRWCDLTGCNAEDVVGDGWMTIIHPDDRAVLARAWRKAVEQHAALATEVRVIRRSDATERSVLMQRLPNLAPDGEFLGHLGTLTDLTVLKEKEATLNTRERQLAAAVDEREILLRELHHRVKNNLQVISSLLTLQLGQLNDSAVKKVLGESQARITAMAAVHEHLYRSDDLRAVDLEDYLETVSTSVLSLRQRGDVEITLSASVEKVRLSLDDAVLCGLVVNELLSNCAKHAFRDRQRGHVWLSARQHGSDLELGVRDDGIGLDPDFDLAASHSLGLQIAREIGTQLGGTLEATDTRQTTFVLRFPLKAVDVVSALPRP